MGLVIQFVEKMIDKELKAILKNIESRLTKIESRIGDIDVDLTQDRRHIDQFKIELEATKSTVEALSGQMTRSQAKTVQAVQDAVSETTEPLRAEVKELNKKPVINVTEKQAKNISWIRKLYGKMAEWKLR